MKRTLFTKSFIVRMSVLLGLLAISLLCDHNFINGCQHAFLSATNSSSANIHGLTMWYQSWNALQKAIPFSLMFFVIGRFLLLFAEHRLHHFRLHAGLAKASPKTKKAMQKAVERHKCLLIAEAGLSCLVIACLFLANGLPAVLATGICSFIAFFLLDASWQRLRTAEERFEQEFEEDPHERITIGETMEVEVDGIWVGGEVMEILDKHVRLEAPAPTADDPDRKTTIWVPLVKIEDNITKHTPPPRPKQKVSFQDKQAHRPSKKEASETETTDPSKSDLEKTDPNKTES